MADIKAPDQMEIVLVADETGVKFKDAYVSFGIRFPESPFLGGLEKAKLVLDDPAKEALSTFFRATMEAMIAKHGCCSIDDAIEKYPKAKAPVQP